MSIPLGRQADARVRETLDDLRRASVKIRKNRVPPHSAKPVAGVCGIGFLPVHDAMPETAFGRADLLSDLVTLVQTREVQP